MEELRTVTQEYERQRRCTRCGYEILAGEKHIRFQHAVVMRASQTINYCAVCVAKAYKEVKPQLKKIRERRLLDKI